MHARGRTVRYLLILAVILALGALYTAQSQRQAVRLESQEMPNETVEELVVGADLIVVGRITRVENGRTIGAPDQVRGILRTQLARLAVDDVIRGAAGDAVTLEEIRALGDGQVAQLGDLRPSRVGDAGVYLLVSGDVDGWYGLSGPQGRFLLTEDGGELQRLDGDPLLQGLTKLSPRQLRAELTNAG